MNYSSAEHLYGDNDSIYSKVEFSKQLAQSSLLSDELIQRSASQFGIRPNTLLDQNIMENEIYPLSQRRRPLLPQQQQQQQQRQQRSLRLPTTTTQEEEEEEQEEGHDKWKPQDLDEQSELQFLVRHLQRENEQLLMALQRSHDGLIKCRQEKRLLEDMLQDQRKMTLDKELEDCISGTPSNEWSKQELLALVEQVEQRQKRDIQHRNDLLFQKQYLMLANAALESCEQESLDVLQQLGVTKADPPLSPWSKCRACMWTIIAVKRFQAGVSSSLANRVNHDDHSSWQ
ncbi:uncharacterized protein BX664DRAFT_342217 [Halteromyces radiatus]|uniref:uncharacterized protein n=1 Tax=Halteromyces radiatus TaxID=101107 RepID=UPI00221EDB65|nr:uncharacterized protein BX664DRAFT_342217 [Halteromyces radiatus]KAI8080060.1 hypothetical protein BX664DRAFT_342217 [Halteromyces radiatus]